MKKKTRKSRKITAVVANVKEDGNVDIKIERKKKPKAMLFEVDNGQWSEVGNKHDLQSLLQKALSRPSYPQCLPLKELKETSYGRTITVVAEYVDARDKDGKIVPYKMEAGRMAAQVGHAVSKLKLGYAMWLTQGDIEKAYDAVRELWDTPITNIVLKARDSNELNHIATLCEAKSLHKVEFRDDSPAYGHKERVLTAIAIGPVTPSQVYGITDYLPLWKEATDPVG